MMTRKESRQASADYLNYISRDELFERYEITRTAKIDGLDIIGVPVYSCCRPASKTLSVSAGKSQVAATARAGAIAEGIEFYIFENPRGPYVQGFCDIPELTDHQMRHREFTPETPILLEPVTKLSTGKPVMFPSELIWLHPRELCQKFYFMRSTNGQALGGTFVDAFLQSLYEVVERDQVVLWRISMERLDVLPPLVAVPKKLSGIADRILQASLKLYLFGCHVDIDLPVFWAMLIDPYTETGTFNGWGCHLTNEIAAERAILEAIQSRGVYISGARDDITRHELKTNQEMDPRFITSALDKITPEPFPPSLDADSITLDEELSAVMDAMADWRDRIYYKPIRVNEHLIAVKTIVLGFEQPNINDLIEGWRSTRWEKLRRTNGAHTDKRIERWSKNNPGYPL